MAWNDLNAQLSVLSLTPEDVLVVSLQTPLSAQDHQRLGAALCQALQAHGFQNLIVVLQPGMTLTTQPVSAFQEGAPHA